METRQVYNRPLCTVTFLVRAGRTCYVDDEVRFYFSQLLGYQIRLLAKVFPSLRSAVLFEFSKERMFQADVL